MDFGVSSLVGFVSSENKETSQLLSMEAKPKLVPDEFRFGNKQERSSAVSDDCYVQKTMLLHRNNTPLLRSNSMVHGDTQQQGLISNYSSSKPEVTTLTRKDDGFVQRSFKTHTGFPYYRSPSAYARRIGNVTGNVNRASSGIRGPFTPYQLMELKHQSLIFKYISAGASVPTNLLIPLRNKSVYPYGLAPPTASLLSPYSLGGSNLGLNYANTNDPEPGRCRRTDGKKWRCSKDVVPDQKYCERHINRGRHRSRKPVEGQTDSAAKAGSSNSKVVLPVNTSMAPSVLTNPGATNSLVITQQKFKNLEPERPNSSLDAFLNRYSQGIRNVHDSGKPQDLMGFSNNVSSTMNLKPDQSALILPNKNIPIQESSQSEIGLVSPDSDITPTQSVSFMNCKSFESFPSFDDLENQDQHPFCQCFDDWPEDNLIAPSLPARVNQHSWGGNCCTQLEYSSNGILQKETEGFASSSSPKGETKLKNNEDGVLNDDAVGSSSVSSSTI
eukprot:XP_015583489.1 growth-regulating factor 2 [Ricinus communis]